jgi:hypothetical protein
MAKVTVKVECDSCNGTGVYSGFAEPVGVAVVCLGCNGTGCDTLVYTPFIKIRERKGILAVRRSRGDFLADGVGPRGKEITYAEFKKGKRP